MKMMEYSIGSVADLISGSTTPNKRKVVEKQFKMKPKKKVLEKNKIKIEPDKAQGKLNRKRKNINLKQYNPKENVIKTEDPPVIKLKKKRLTSSNSKQESLEIIPDIKQEDTSDDEQFNNVIETEDPPVIKLKKKRLTSPNSKQESLRIIPDINQEDTSDDEQFNNKSKTKKQKIEKITPRNPDHVTVFVGNLPITTSNKKLGKLFSKLGNVVNARIRSIPVADLKVPKKVAAIKKQFHPDRKSVNGYVTFASHADATNALTLNGQEYKDHHIRVNICNEQLSPDKTKAIFLGNVSFAAEEEELWKLFESCGEIESVRLVRDQRTDIGKGFGYINFKSADSVELALQMGEVKLRDRPLRISLYNSKAPKKTKSKTTDKNIKRSNKQKDEVTVTATKGEFQGKFATEKKKKFNKGNQQKKKLAKKIAPKTISS